jgi:hypothetical protein
MANGPNQAEPLFPAIPTVQMIEAMAVVTLI